MTTTSETPAVTPAAPVKRRWPLVVGVGVVCFFVGIGVGSTGSQQANTSAPTNTGTNPGVAPPSMAHLPATVPVPAAPTGPADTITTDGTYVIGTDLQPGTYKASPVGQCYWARLSSTADESDIIANHLASGPTTVTIAKSDAAFVSRDCGPWTKVH